MILSIFTQLPGSFATNHFFFFFAGRRQLNLVRGRSKRCQEKQWRSEKRGEKTDGEVEWLDEAFYDVLLKKLTTRLVLPLTIKLF
jgi:hypothetical protein